MVTGRPIKALFVNLSLLTSDPTVPTGDGIIYYNASTNVFRMRMSSTWSDV